MAHRLDIGLVNNMPDSALEGTERQFRALLEGAASDGIEVCLTFFALPEVPRGESGRTRVSHYPDIGNLRATRLDGIIVTGTEPKASDLTKEPYWGSLTNLLDWAEENTYSSIWSCLAAHAAVLHLDGVERRPLNVKRFGVYDGTSASDHALTTGAPASPRMPHSRWNDLSETSLAEHGYQVLTRSEAGVDAFVKQRKSLFVFFQGHPEYEADTLLLEYRRDIKRFLRQERETYPPMPVGYFNESSTLLLTAFQALAQSNRREDMIDEFPTSDMVASVTTTWRSAATSVYRNWLGYLVACR